MKLFAPGPTEVHPDVFAAMTHPQIAHRTDALRELVAAITARLRHLLATKGEIFLATSSATGALEGALRNLASGKTLVLRAGSWGSRLAELAAANGLDVDTLDVPPGRIHDPSDLARRLDRGDVATVALVHCETSTAVLEPLADLARVVRERSDALLLVDAVSSLFGVEIRLDDLGVDVCVAGVQKALALPPGLSLIVASDRALDRARRVPRRGFYFDFLRFLENARRHETPTTPSTAHLFALDVALDRVLAEGMARRAARHVEMSRLCRDWARRRLALFGDPDHPSPTVTCIETPRGCAPDRILEGALRRGYRLGAGYGPLRDRTFRIGHMGEHTPDDVAELLLVLDDVLSEAKG